MNDSDKTLDMQLEDGPWVTVRRYFEQVTVKFDWSVNQRWYLTQDEARKLALAILDATDKPQDLTEHTAAAIEKILGT